MQHVVPLRQPMPSCMAHVVPLGQPMPSCMAHVVPLGQPMPSCMAHPTGDVLDKAARHRYVHSACCQPPRPLWLTANDDVRGAAVTYERLILHDIQFDMIVEAPVAFNQVRPSEGPCTPRHVAHACTYTSPAGEYCCSSCIREVVACKYRFTACNSPYIC
jgi:hypothetical protein